jgi:hypothetical protein
MFRIITKAISQAITRELRLLIMRIFLSIGGA